MKNTIKVIASFIILFSSYSYAEPTIVDVWQCKFNEGKTMKDADALNDKWVKFMNANVKGGGIVSYNLEPRVGKRNVFMFVDVYPNMQSWAAGENVMENSEEGKALSKEFNALADCSSNSLYSSTKH
ncbi:hypothetical protein RGQ13_11430 [Thalassotalea psychrophila]|uniref:ABM domain-containing protein n=1 Tax=Thalassotalea psychrophila TaxID=3065647 RepID=A0ABY9TPI4_9GAMM|nr:hypothetical protein RGQ13_11430 [Colwelliaceae bacterium SQ149]